MSSEGGHASRGSDLWIFPEGPDFEARALAQLETIAAALTRIADVLETSTLGVKVER